MVQFKTDDIAYRKSTYDYTDDTDTANSYWKLGLDSYEDKTIKQLIEYLRDKGHKCREKVSRPVVVDAVGRYERGLMSYDGRSVDELQAFCKARGLPAKATTASRLARALENADDLATFPRFLDLPAELRNFIYELHFHDFEPFAGQHVQPPLTLASRQLRSEALPLFYDCATFKLCARSLLPRMGGVRPAGQEYIRLYSCFKSMPAANFARIKKFDLHWRDRLLSGSKLEVAVRFAATSERTNPDAMDLILEDALKMGLESKFKTIDNAREMLTRGEQPLTMTISGDLYNILQTRPDRSGSRYTRVGVLALRNVEFD